ncbi:transcriptional regulator (plasmid) [Leptolyngbya boryana NIES-2135]|jgi:MerR family copper efflux transcriptional regulator|uniref:Transcriptional regulator n=1 Tax=Leptolyngbya boryana NIES-2135 TaxID=1973484 RepID=A0A1Z4JRY4_LEPBY|nr:MULTISPECIES: heavy metal-responsive transcriptional regulator [Leptolyngbya]BAY59464.1 transcriptional regulator [Leptolyngbya boryana NIES-2135]MBD2373047.1 heavy metal-responsive transcriptional regulator [Leptolyngbya sp. FACHB-238]MBD2397198.1 heavy metal-responsive transcriptional regulator [Leptolyngbya sp. FACHB-239]MBD2403996.1 heavy metal-responsive transcriptional regulator [Leptolyngbya sp. FACHB-402]ULP33290.1 heavy metal-responsive transcriptional regulator [Leptolyngbya borya
MIVQEEPRLIGSVAKESGIPIKTIRYYEELGLLKTAGRTEGGYRLFNADVFARLNFIKRAQNLGMSLSEIREFLNIHDQGDLPCDHVQETLRDKLIDIDRQIQQLQILKQELKRLLAEEDVLSENSTAIICPIIEQG